MAAGAAAGPATSAPRSDGRHHQHEAGCPCHPARRHAGRQAASACCWWSSQRSVVAAGRLRQRRRCGPHRSRCTAIGGRVTATARRLEERAVAADVVDAAVAVERRAVSATCRRLAGGVDVLRPRLASLHSTRHGARRRQRGPRHPARQNPRSALVPASGSMAVRAARSVPLAEDVAGRAEDQHRMVAHGARRSGCRRQTPSPGRSRCRPGAPVDLIDRARRRHRRAPVTVTGVVAGVLDEDLDRRKLARLGSPSPVSEWSLPGLRTRTGVLLELRRPRRCASGVAATCVPRSRRAATSRAQTATTRAGTAGGKSGDWRCGTWRPRFLGSTTRFLAPHGPSRSGRAPDPNGAFAGRWQPGPPAGDTPVPVVQTAAVPPLTCANAAGVIQIKMTRSRSCGSSGPRRTVTTTSSTYTGVVIHI